MIPAPAPPPTDREEPDVPPSLRFTRAARSVAIASLAGAALVFAVTEATAAGNAIPPAARAAKATVNVLYAGSLVDYMENDLGPAFAKASGFGYQGYGAGSTEVASQIRGGVRQGDVFISAAAAADQSLEGSANGNWVSWYSSFAGTPLLLGYNPKSKIAAELRRGVPWYKVVTQSGVLVGRTDPVLDPKGVLTVQAVDNAAAKLHDPALQSALNSFSTYPEESLVGRLQSGQLDAGFFYAVEANAAHIPTVSLAPVYKYAIYTLTVLNRAANPTGAAAFVSFLLNSQRTATLERNGLNPLPRPQFSGSAAAVPAGLRSVVGAG
jgi:molybdate transport system substrate-binding protein